MPMMGQELTLLPYPKSVDLNAGNCRILDKNKITVVYPELSNEYTNSKDQLTAIFYDKEIKWSKKGTGEVIFEIIAKNNFLLPEKSEAYSLYITAENVKVVARSEAGFFYAIQTLKQLFNHQLHPTIPCLEITDYPSLPNRGLMDDISRGPLPNLTFAKEQIRRLSSLKFNLFTFYIEHVVKTKAHGSFAPQNGLTVEEIEELSDYARLHNMKLAGSFQSLGHFDKILEFPHYSNLGATNRMLKPGDSSSIEFVKQVIDEMIAAFEAPFFNLNGDEAWDLDRVAMNHPEELTSGKLYVRHMKPLLTHVIDHGVRPLMWGDILMNHPEIINEIPSETIILTWDYSARESFAEWIDPFKNSKMDFWVCPGVLNSNRFYPNFDEAFGNIDGFIQEGLDQKAKGMLLTVWDDGGRHFFSRDWPGVAYGAEQSWHRSDDVSKSFMDRFSKLYYNDETGSFNSFLKIMQSLKTSPAMLNLNNGAVQKDIFPDYDQELSFKISDWQSILDSVTKANLYLNELEVKDGQFQEDFIFWRYTTTQLALLAESRIRMVDMTHDYVESSILQLSSPADALARLKLIGFQLDTLQNQWQSLYQEFKSLWLEENRTYWMKEANSLYEKHLQSLQSLKERHGEIVNQFSPKDGHYLPAPAKVGFTVSDITSSYFNYWLVAGPFKINDYEKDTQHDFLMDMGGELAARPIPGQLFTTEDGSQMMWDKVSSTYDDKMVPSELFQESTKVLAYAYSQIKASKPMDVYATFGSNDGIVVMLNGEEIFRKHVKRNLIKDENRVKLSLEAGTNHLLIKSDQWKGKWEFSFTLQDVKWSSHKHKYTILD